MDQQITAVIINRKEHKLVVRTGIHSLAVQQVRRSVIDVFVLQKGCGYHLDLLMVGVMLAVCSIMGLPWFVAATVLSISHVNSLKLESESSAPGEQPRFLGIREQRLTGLVIFLLMGCSVFMTGALQVSETSCGQNTGTWNMFIQAHRSVYFQFIPMPVLYGVFLYMGVSSLKGIQV